VVILNDDLEKNIKVTKTIDLGLSNNKLIIDDEKDMLIIAIIKNVKEKIKNSNIIN